MSILVACSNFSLRLYYTFECPFIISVCKVVKSRKNTRVSTDTDTDTEYDTETINDLMIEIKKAMTEPGNFALQKSPSLNENSMDTV